MTHSSIYDIETVPSYNGNRVRDLDVTVPMPPTLSQYWETRASKLSAVIREREERSVTPSAAEEDFSTYCRTHTDFLKRYFDSASRPLASQLADYWKLGIFRTEVAHSTKRDFQQDGKIELLLATEGMPARFLRVPGRDNRPYDWVDYPNLSDPRIAVGKSVICVRVERR
jgi:hypothetical protein